MYSILTFLGHKNLITWFLGQYFQKQMQQGGGFFLSSLKKGCQIFSLKIYFDKLQFLL